MQYVILYRSIAAPDMIMWFLYQYVYVVMQIIYMDVMNGYLDFPCEIFHFAK